MQLVKTASLLCALAAYAASVSAVPFDNATNGGVATVGTGGDYASLKAAADAFNALTTPHLQGHWKLEVLNDLTEPENVAFGNTIPAGSSLTLKPATGATPVINFTKVTANAGPKGNLIIGTANPAGWTFIPTSNFIIDGSNNGTDSRDLTITNDAAISYDVACPVVIAGNTDGTVIKNCSLINGTSGTGPGVAAVSALMYNNLCPDNFQIHNCYVFAPQGNGVYLRAEGSSPALGMTGWVIDDCEIHSRLHGIWLDGGLAGTVQHNIVNSGTVGSPVSGALQHGIILSHARGQGNKFLNISGNQIFVQSANSTGGNFGIAAISVAVGTATPSTSSNTANIFNNMINVQFTTQAPTASNMVYVGIRLNSTMNYNVHHNSLNMPNFPNLTGLSPTGSTITADASAIRFPMQGSYVASAYNNIVRLQQVGMTGMNIASISGTPTKNFDYNNYVIGAGAYYGSTGSSTPTNRATLTSWRTGSGEDANAFSVDPTTTGNAAWNVVATSADLHFTPMTAKPAGMPGIPAVAAVSEDIDGDLRNIVPGAGGVYPGADEGVVALPVALSSFGVE